MVAKTDQNKQKLGAMLKRIIKNNKIKQKEFAKIIGVSEQYVSKLINGYGAPSAEQFDTLFTFFQPHLTENEQNALCDLFIAAKAGFYSPQVQTEDALTLQFCKKFENLFPEQQIQVISQMEQFEEINRNTK